MLHNPKVAGSIPAGVNILCSWTSHSTLPESHQQHFEILVVHLPQTAKTKQCCSCPADNQTSTLFEHVICVDMTHTADDNSLYWLHKVIPNRSKLRTTESFAGTTTNNNLVVRGRTTVFFLIPTLLTKHMRSCYELSPQSIAPRYEYVTMELNVKILLSVL